MWMSHDQVIVAILNCIIFAYLIHLPFYSHFSLFIPFGGSSNLLAQQSKAKLLIGEWEGSSSGWEFKQDGTFCKKEHYSYSLGNYGWHRYNGKYSVKGDNIMLFWDSGGQDIFSYDITNSQLTLDGSTYTRSDTPIMSDNELSNLVVGTWTVASGGNVGPSLRYGSTMTLYFFPKKANERYASFVKVTSNYNTYDPSGSVSGQSKEQGYYFISNGNLIMIDEQIGKKISYFIKSVNEKYMSIGDEVWTREN